MSKPLSLFQQMQIQRDEAIERAEKAFQYLEDALATDSATKGEANHEP